MVSISWLLGLAFLYRLRFLTKIFLDWQLTLTTQLCTSKLPDNPVNGLHVLDRPRLAGVKTSKNWQGKAEILACNWPALAGAKNWSSLPKNLGQPGQDQVTGSQSYRV